MSESKEIALGNALRKQAVQQFFGQPADDTELSDYIWEIGRKLAFQSHRPNLGWRFMVVNDSRINAFAMPGGNIFITRGILLKMNSEDELASILGHEIGHVTARHHAQQYTRASLANLAVMGAGIGAAALGGEAAGRLGSQLASVAGGLVLTSYSRDQERQADQLGYEYMTKAGYNPQGQVDAFQMMSSLREEEPSAIELMMSTHPLTSERIATARRRLARTSPALRDKPLQTARYQKMLAKQRKRAPAYAAMDRGDAYQAKKRYAEAFRQYEQASRLFPGEGLFYTKAALALVSRKRFGEARQWAQKGADLNSGLFLSQVLAGYLDLKTGNTGEAILYLQIADRILPGHALNLFLLGVAYEKNRDRRRAAGYYQRVMRLDPKGKLGYAAYQRLRRL